MYKNEFLQQVAERYHIPHSYVSLVTDSLQEAIMETVANGEKIVFPGFGTFDKRLYAARIGRNPQTGEAKAIPAMDIPTFKAAKGFRDRLRK